MTKQEAKTIDRKLAKIQKQIWEAGNLTHEAYKGLLFVRNMVEQQYKIDDRPRVAADIKNILQS